MSFFCTIASGSKGNAAILSYGSTNLLIDAGISCRRLAEELKKLDIKLSDLTAVLVTHEHSDHIRGIETLYHNTTIPIYMSVGTACSVETFLPFIHNAAGVFYAGDRFEIGEIGVETFSTPHDAADSVGFRFYAGNSVLGYATDLGHITPEIKKRLMGLECLFIESNHDIFSLLQGPYPDFLKRRIVGRLGHLSNDDCADLVADAVRNGTRWITLCHLSEQNNTPELAVKATKGVLESLDALKPDGPTIGVAPPHSICTPYFF